MFEPRSNRPTTFPGSSGPPAAACATAGRLLRWVLAAALVTTLPAVAADSGVGPTGWVDGFEGHAAGYRIVRAGQTIPVRALMPLYAGDRIEVTAAAGRLRFHASETESLDIEAGDPAVSVRGAEAGPTPWRNFLAWADSFFAELEQAQTAQMVPVVTRGDEGGPLASGLLHPPTVGLAAGRRHLALAWRGGRAPYAVQLAANGGQGAALAEVGGLAEPKCLVPETELRPGTYRLEIRDAEGQTLVTDLVAAAPADVPRFDPAWLPAGLATEARATLEAAWLASQGDGWVWRLEAYQQLPSEAADASGASLRAALLDSKAILRK